jgi:hypothetical protein
MEGKKRALGAGPRIDAPALTSEQLTAFAEVTGEPRAVTRQRLDADPTLLPSAVAAAEARMQRKRTGKIHTAVGFSLFGVGAIAGYVLISTAFQRAGDGYDVSGDRILLGLVVIAATSGVGLPLGIGGIVKMARQSEAETVALDGYQRSRVPLTPALDAAAYPAARSGYVLRVPLLSLCF